MPEGIWSSIEARANGCWEWTKSRTTAGYGNRKWDGVHGIHRIIYTELVGEIPPKYSIDHLCNNRLCCNPLHLEPVEHRVNVLRGTGPALLAARQLGKTHCPRGHSYSGNNLIFTSAGWRVCRLCEVIKQRAYRARKRASNAK